MRKKTGMITLLALGLSAWISHHGWVSEGKIQMVFEADIGFGIKAHLMVIDSPAQRATIQTDFIKACQPSGKPDFAVIEETARVVAQKMKKFSDSEPQLATDILTKGYIADTIVRSLTSAGHKNLFLELDGIFVVRGEDFNGPWKVPVSDQTTTYAQHTFLYKAHDTAVATVAFQPAAGPDHPYTGLKSVTVFTTDGALMAQGLATAAATLNPELVKKFLKVSGVPRAVLIDSAGKFIQFPEK